MDNMCTIYDVNNRDGSGTAKIVRELAGYEGFLSSCRFLDDTHIVTGSGDMKICVWDLEAGKKTAEMDGHEGDVVNFVFSITPSREKKMMKTSFERFQFHYRRIKPPLSLVPLIKHQNFGIFVRANQSKHSLDIRPMSTVYL